MKKLLISIFAILFSFQLLFASELFIEPSNGALGNGCVVPFEITVDTLGAEVITSDIILESSMEYIDFVAGDFFKYIFPPKVREDDGFIHLIAFDTEKESLPSGKGLIGTVYFKVNETSDPFINFYFNKVGSTIDSNVSQLGGVETLTQVFGGKYSIGGEHCVEDIVIDGGLSHKSYDDALDDVLNDVSNDMLINKLINVGYYAIPGIFLILIILFILKRRKKKGEEK